MFPEPKHPGLDPAQVEEARNLSMGEKWLRIGELQRLARELHAQRTKRIYPDATPTEIHEDWLYVTLGTEIVEELRKAGHLPAR